MITNIGWNNRMLTQEQIANAADRLYEAEKNRQQIPALTLEFPDMTMDDSYKIQKAWVDRKIAEGDSVRGYKIGLTSRAMQMAVNIEKALLTLPTKPLEFYSTSPADGLSAHQMTRSNSINDALSNLSSTAHSSLSSCSDAKSKASEVISQLTTPFTGMAEGLTCGSLDDVRSQLSIETVNSETHVERRIPDWGSLRALSD